MNNFDFTTPENWKFKGITVTYSPTTELGFEIGEELCYLMAEANGSQLGDHHFYDDKVLLEQIEMNTVKGRFHHKGTCDHCGARFQYGAVFQDSVTGDYAVVGNTCARNDLNLSSSERLHKHAVTLVTRAKSKARGDYRVAALAPNRRRVLGYDHRIVKEMYIRFRSDGYLTLKQWALAKKIANHVEAQISTSNWVGSVKERLEFTVTIKAITGWNVASYSGYGSDWVSLYIMEDAAGNVIVYKTASQLWKADGRNSAEKGDTITIKATVKAHDTRQGVKQTIVQRAKVI